MNIYVHSKRKIRVRTLEKEDIPNILKLVSFENFGYIGIDREYGPNVYDTKKSLDMIESKEIISSKALIIEEKGQFKGYAIIDRPCENMYYISQIAVLPQYRRQRYGSILLDVIKKLAKQDNSIIRLTCKSYEGSRFYDKMRIFRDNKFSDTRHSCDMNTIIRKKLPNIFPDYEKIREEEIKETEERVKQFTKFLSSDLGKRIAKI